MDRLVRAHVEAEFAKLRSPNKMDLFRERAGMWWYRDPEAPNFLAAAAATRRVHATEPVLTREGGSIPITMVFEEACDATCVLLPIGAGDDGAHSQNEKIDRATIAGIVLACYMDELARLRRRKRRGDAAEARAKRSCQASGAWRRACKKDPTVYGCECRLLSGDDGGSRPPRVEAVASIHQMHARPPARHCARPASVMWAGCGWFGLEGCLHLFMCPRGGDPTCAAAFGHSGMCVTCRVVRCSARFAACVHCVCVILDSTFEGDAQTQIHKLP